MTEHLESLMYDPIVEYRAAFFAGKDVASLEEEAVRIGMNYNKDRALYATEAKEITEKILSAPTLPDFRYDEPDSYEEILAARPTKRHKFVNTMTDEEMYDKILGAWAGRVAGCLFGKPLEGVRAPKIERMCRETGNYPPTRYLRFSDFSDATVKELGIWDKAAWGDTFGGRAPIDDDIMYTVFSLYLLENRGFGFTSDDIVDGWTKTIPGIYCCTAEHVAYINHLTGLRGAECREFCNPYREFLGAQIRTDLYAYVNPADPERAAEMAYRDSRATHEKNAVYGAMFVNAMISAAAVSDDIMTVIEAGLGEIPVNCRLAHNVKKTVDEYTAGKTFAELKASIHAQYDENYFFDWCYAVPNCMIIVASLLCGNGDYTRSTGLSVTAGFDTDCNAATVGSIIGMMKGRSAVSDEWTEPFCEIITSPVADYNLLTLREAAERTLKLYKLNPYRKK